MTLSPASVRNVMSGSRAARPHLCAAHLGRAAADRARPAFLRRRADAGRRSDRARSQRDRGPGRRLGSGQVGRDGADRGVRAALRAHPRRRRRADRESEPAIQAHRVRPARARARARGSGRRGRPGRESRSQHPGRPADVGADRGRQFPQRPHPRPHSARGQGRDRAALEEGQAELDALTQKIIAAGLASWSGGETRRAQADRARPGQSARGPQGARRSRARPAPVRRSGNASAT